jgi:inosine-uridine nucleoside N-ribohydrolase
MKQRYSDIQVMLALMSDDTEIVGLTIVFGNIAVDQAACNILHVLELVGRTDIPVFMGSPRPILPKLDEAGAPMKPHLEGYPVHDILAIASLIDEQAFKTEKLHVTVEMHGHATRGQTVADKRRTSPKVKQMKICGGVDVERVFQTYFDKIAASAAGDNR